MNDEFLTADEVAQLLRMPLSTVHKLAREGTLHGFKIGKAWRFRKTRLLEHIAQLEREADGRAQEEDGHDRP
jgi:excisionase family DNA binding protein